MRFFKLFITFLTIGVLLSSGIGLALLAGRIWWVGYQLSGDFLEIKRLAILDDNKYFKKCAPLVTQPKNKQNKEVKNPVWGYGLRFTDISHYVIEALCVDERMGPIKIKSGELEFGVQKIRGSGVKVQLPLVGEVIKPVNATVILSDHWLFAEVGLINDQTVSRLHWRGKEMNVDTDSPSTVCAGWGDLCCDPVGSVGLGLVETRTLDCPKQCYPTCRQRPILVYFSTDPVMDTEKRTVSITGQSVQVTFGFEVSDSQATIKSVELNYGDGSSYTAQNTQEVVNHTYACALSTCTYRVTIGATDIDGVAMADSRLRELTIFQQSR